MFAAALSSSHVFASWPFQSGSSGWRLLGNHGHSEVGDDPAAQVKRLYLLTLSRPPRAEELDIGLKLLGAKNPDALRHYCHLVLGLNEMIYVN